MLTTPLAACWCFEVAGRQCGHGFYPCAHPSTSIPASLPSSCWPSPWLLPDTSVPYLALIMLIFAVGGDGKWGNWKLGVVGRGRCVVVVLPVTSELQPGGLCCVTVVLSTSWGLLRARRDRGLVVPLLGREGVAASLRGAWRRWGCQGLLLVCAHVESIPSPAWGAEGSLGGVCGGGFCRQVLTVTMAGGR